MIDIIVPTYNRPQDIEKFVFEIQKQTFRDFHVYIVDDFGERPIEHLVPKDNSRFTYIRLPENKGQAHARNVAIEKGTGDTIVSLDDDAWFEHENALSLISPYFQSYPGLGCLMFDVKTPQDDYISKGHNIGDGQLIGSHITCGCAYSRAGLQRINGFGGFLHSGAEETDVSLKLLTEGYEIRLAHKIPVFHNYHPGIRTPKWYRAFRFNSTRNDLLIVVMRYPFKQVFPYFFGKYISHVIFSFRNKRDPFVAGLYTLMALPAALLMLPKAFKYRKPLPQKTIFSMAENSLVILAFFHLKEKQFSFIFSKISYICTPE